KDVLTVGRAAENDIHLADLAVETNHARIALQPGPRVSVQATGTLGFTLDGQTQRSAAIDPRTGGELRFGGTRIVVGMEADAGLLGGEPVADEAEGAFEAEGT